MSYTENLSHQSQMLSPGTPAPPRSAPSLISMHLCFHEEDGSFLPPKCSNFILTMLLGMSLQMIVSTSLLLGWCYARYASRPFSSKPPTVIESLPDFLYHLPFYASVEIAALSFFFLCLLIVYESSTDDDQFSKGRCHSFYPLCSLRASSKVLKTKEIVGPQSTLAWG